MYYFDVEIEGDGVVLFEIIESGLEDAGDDIFVLIIQTCILLLQRSSAHMAVSS